MTEEEVEIGNETSQYPYSVKITQTAYGARVSVHAYNTTANDVINDAIYLYDSTREQLQRRFKLAPEEDPKLKKENNSNEK